MAICYLYESAYFPAPYADNQLLYSLCDPKRSHAFNSASFKHNNQVEQWIVQLLQFHPKNTPELISEGQKSKAFPQTPLADALRALKSHNGTLLFKILDPPLPCQCNGPFAPDSFSCADLEAFFITVSNMWTANTQQMSLSLPPFFVCLFQYLIVVP